jgi:CIC family chloride channel protein
MSDLPAAPEPSRPPQDGGDGAASKNQPEKDEGRRIGTTRLSVLALVVGMITGIGAVIVTFLVEKFAPEARGHGVPEVMDAVYYKGGVIRPAVALVKSLASAVAIGSGSAVGREGPIIQIGSALGSSLGQLIRVVASERIILVAAGAGAGIAATFNTPIGGVLFAIELILPEVSVRSFLPVAIATGTATFIGQFYFGAQPAFIVPEFAPLAIDGSAVVSLCLYAVLGILTGLAAAAFVRGLHLFEDLFDKIKQRYARHMLGMLLVGIMIYALHETFGQYYVDGVGYATIQNILEGQMSFFELLALLFVCKLLATSLSLGSGSSGGIFSPSLYMGATIGGAFAALLTIMHLPIPVSIPSFAMVGMGAMVGGGTGAVMTAITMIFEMTRDYNIVLPMIVAVALSVGVRRMLSPENIYTLKLFRRGHFIPKARHANMFLVRRARDVMETDIAIVPAETSFEEFLRRPEHKGRMRHVVVTRGDHILGVLRINTGLRHGLESLHTNVTLGDVAYRNFTIVREDEIAFNVIRRLWRKQATMAVIISSQALQRLPRHADVVGVLTKEHVADSVAESIEIYPG